VTWELGKTCPATQLESVLAQVVFSLSPIGLLYTSNLQIRHANQAMAEMFGYSRTQLEGSPLSVLRTQGADWFDSKCQSAIETSGFWQVERVMTRVSGETFWCRILGRSVNPEKPRLDIIWNVVELSDRRSLSCLSPRERQIALSICAGHSAKETANHLGLSPRTVETSLARIRQKMRARNSNQLANRIRSYA
jgi:PAS domain S-box-containing protein